MSRTVVFGGNAIGSEGRNTCPSNRASIVVAISTSTDTGDPPILYRP